MMMKTTRAGGIWHIHISSIVTATRNTSLSAIPLHHHQCRRGFRVGISPGPYPKTSSEPAIDNSGLLHRPGVDPDPSHHNEHHLANDIHFKAASPPAATEQLLKKARRVWRAAGGKNGPIQMDSWEPCNVEEGLKNVKPFEQPFKALGVVDSDKALDLKIMITNYTAPALAAGLRDREETLQLCARLLADNNLDQLKKVLHPYQEGPIIKRRRKTRILDLSGGLQPKHLNMLRKYLHRAPRQLTRAVSLRASVVIPLCNVDGVACILFERRSNLMRSFKNQVCFPGGMVEESTDVNIMETSLREMEEEIGIPAKSVDVLGVLRCDWSEVAKITGIGVTPVVGFLGDMSEQPLNPNRDEVSECFTIPLYQLLERRNWVQSNVDGTVIFVGGPHVIWGLTAYILERFLKDILLRYKIDQ